MPLPRRSASPRIRWRSRFSWRPCSRPCTPWWQHPHPRSMPGRWHRSSAMESMVWLTRTQAAAYLGVAVGLLEHWAGTHAGPAYYTLGRMVRYTQIDLDTWLEAQPYQPGVSAVYQAEA